MQIKIGVTSSRIAQGLLVYVAHGIRKINIPAPEIIMLIIMVIKVMFRIHLNAPAHPHQDLLLAARLIIIQHQARLDRDNPYLKRLGTRCR